MTETKYKIVCYILVEADEEFLFDSKEDAEKEREHREFLQNDNIYRIEEVDR